MPLTPKHKLAELTESLLNQTKRNTIKWEQTSEDGTYRAKLGEYDVITFKDGETSDRLPDVVISLVNRQGQTIEKFADPDLIGLEPTGYDGFYSAMLDLYDLAAGQATGAGKAVDDLLSFLRNMPK